MRPIKEFSFNVGDVILINHRYSFSLIEGEVVGIFEDYDYGKNLGYNECYRDYIIHFEKRINGSAAIKYFDFASIKMVSVHPNQKLLDGYGMWTGDACLANYAVKVFNKDQICFFCKKSAPHQQPNRDGKTIYQCPYCDMMEHLNMININSVYK